MTVTQKNRFKGFLDVVYKIVVTGILTTILYSGGAWKEEIKQLSFDNVDDKVNTKNHIKNSLNAVELDKLKVHVNNPNYHMGKDAKDSVYVSRNEFEDWVKKDIITNYQQKENTNELKTLVRIVIQDISEIKENTNN